MRNIAIFSALSLLAVMAASPALAADKDKQKSADIPTPETPVLAIGDSMMRILGNQIEKKFKEAEIEPVVAFSSLGSGLVRPMVFDWTAKIKELLEANKPKTVFVALGTNDRQTLEAVDGSQIPYGNSEWEPEYAKRIGAVMDQLIEGGVTRVVWLLLPRMKAPANQEHAELLNAVVTREAQAESRKDKVSLLDLGTLLSRNPKKYSAGVMSPTGEFITVRDPDGVHLTADGAKLVASAIIRIYWPDKAK